MINVDLGAKAWRQRLGERSEALLWEVWELVLAAAEDALPQRLLGKGVKGSLRSNRVGRAVFSMRTVDARCFRRRL